MKNVKNNKWFIPGIIVGVILVIILIIASSYNGLVNKREDVRKSFGNVQTQYQRRSDLVPNLVNTVKGAADFEQTTLNQVVEARSKASSIQIDPTKATPAQLQQYQAAQGELGQAISRLLVTVESYPQIKAVEAFRDLQAQLEGTENRIAVARKDFNDTAATYNATVQRFPSNITAGVFNFDTFSYFEADADSQKAPSVNF
jgi:LemA protein